MNLIDRFDFLRRDFEAHVRSRLVGGSDDCPACYGKRYLEILNSKGYVACPVCKPRELTDEEALAVVE
jgi:hypothetical protein